VNARRLYVLLYLLGLRTLSLSPLNVYMLDVVPSSKIYFKIKIKFEKLFN